MFSAASFYDVVESLPEPTPGMVEQAALPLDAPATVGFYGFRGGAGRTLALAHVAVLWARRGLRVVAVDLDVEAPGLPAALGAALPPGCEGAVSLLMEAGRTPPSTPLDVSRHLVPLELKTAPGKVLLLPAGVVSKTGSSAVSVGQNPIRKGKQGAGQVCCGACAVG